MNSSMQSINNCLEKFTHSSPKAGFEREYLSTANKLYKKIAKADALLEEGNIQSLQEIAKSIEQML